MSLKYRFNLCAVITIAGLGASSAYADAVSNTYHRRPRINKNPRREAPAENKELSPEEAAARHWAYVVAQIAGCPDFQTLAWDIGRQMSTPGPDKIDPNLFARYLDAALLKRTPKVDAATRYELKNQLVEYAEFFTHKIHNTFEVSSSDDLEKTIAKLKNTAPEKMSSQARHVAEEIRKRMSNIERDARLADLNKCGNLDVGSKEFAANAQVRRAEAVTNSPRTRRAKKVEKKAKAVASTTPTDSNPVSSHANTNNATDRGADAAVEKFLAKAEAVPAAKVAASDPTDIETQRIVLADGALPKVETKDEPSELGMARSDASTKEDPKVVLEEAKSSHGKKDEALAETKAVEKEKSKIEHLATFGDISNQVSAMLDTRFKTRQLSTRREMTGPRGSLADTVDRCIPDLIEKDRFGDKIAFFVDRHMSLAKEDGATQVKLPKGIANKYDVQKNPVPVNLASHKMCSSLTPDSLRSMLSGKYSAHPSVSQATVTKVNAFADKFNALRSEAATNPKAVDGLRTLWTKMMGCLAFQESLSGPDSKLSDKVASTNGLGSLGTRPPGVLFDAGTDKNGHAVVTPARANNLVLGIYQFTPALDNNIESCVNAWNDRYPRCSVHPKTTSELTDLLASPHQTFNAFCGVNKVETSLYIQANTTAEHSVPPLQTRKTASVNAGVKADERCVSPFFGPNAYNHFGPLQNQSDGALNSVVSCALSD